MNKEELEKELGHILTQMYTNGKSYQEVNAAIQLFGIIYASKINENGLSINKIVEHSNIKISYDKEVRKGKNLAPYITLKPEVNKFIDKIDYESINTMIKPNISSKNNVILEPIQKIYIGPPGSGKSYRAGQYCNVICSDKMISPELFFTMNMKIVIL